jgi:hypothetical protein
VQGYGEFAAVVEDEFAELGTLVEGDSCCYEDAGGDDEACACRLVNCRHIYGEDDVLPFTTGAAIFEGI